LFAGVPPATLANILQKEIQAIDKAVARFPIDTVVHQLGEQTSERRFDAFLLGSFATAALFLSAIAVFVLLHQIVAQRTGEIGLGMALGAAPASVMLIPIRLDRGPAQYLPPLPT